MYKVFLSRGSKANSNDWDRLGPMIVSRLFLSRFPTERWFRVLRGTRCRAIRLMGVVSVEHPQGLTSMHQATNSVS